MKYIVLVCDGAADWPIPQLGDKTIFESTTTPSMDWIASHGRMGLFKTIPDSMAAGSEVANMSIMGYNPEKDLTGRGALEALSAGVELSPTDIAFRCNLITIEQGLIKDYSSGHITSEEAHPLISAADKELGQLGVQFFPGVQYRHILKLDGNIYSDQIVCTPPHDQLDKPYKNFLIKPKDEKDVKAKTTASFLNELIEKSSNILKNHPVNQARAAQNKRMASHLWFWSGGKRPNIVPFKQKFGLQGSVISAVDLIFGIGIAAGLEPLHVKGATGLLDTNYEGKVLAALNSLKEKDYVYLHCEATDEMGHAGDIEKKQLALEYFDRRVVQPILAAEPQFNNELVIAILPDHPTPIKIRTHSREPVPFMVYNPSLDKIHKLNRRFTEKEAQSGEFGLIASGGAFMKCLTQSQN
jgi:2,3-bisphosphoglycerate-independent phosphoglycerate mutase